MARYWVDTCTFKKIKKNFKKIFKKIKKIQRNKTNYEVTHGSHCSWSLMI